MANLIMDNDCQNQEDDVQDPDAVVVNPAAEEHRIPPKKKPSRSASAGVGGVRRIIEKRFQSTSHLMNEKDDVKTAKQWSQRLQNHLETKNMLGPSNHEKEIKKKKSNSDYFDGEASDPDILTTNQPQDKTYSASSRLERSITAEIAAAWLSPTRKSTSRNNSSNNGSYANLNDDRNQKQGSRSQFKRRTSLRSGSDDIFPPPPPVHNHHDNDTLPDDRGSADGSHNSNNNISSGNLSNSGPQSEINYNKESNSKREQHSPPNISTKQSKALTPKARKSLFGKGVPLPKHLTDFRLMLQGKEKDSIDEEGTVSFSITSERITNGDTTDAEDASEEQEEPSNRRKPLHKGKGAGRKRSKSGATQDQAEGQTEQIEWRREKFKYKLSTATKNMEQTQNAPHLTSPADFVRELQQTIAGRMNHLNEQLSTNSSTVDSAKVKTTGTLAAPHKSTSLREKFEDGSKSKKVNGDGASLVDMFDDDDAAFFGTAFGKEIKPTSPKIATIAGAVKKTSSFENSAASTPIRRGKLTRSRTTSEVEKSSTFFSSPKPKTRESMSNASVRSQRSVTSQKSERTNSSTGSKKKSDTSARSERTGGSHLSDRRRRATMAATTEVTLEQSFQTHDADIVVSPRPEPKRRDSKKSGSSGSRSSLKPHQISTSRFNQSFSLDSLVSPYHKTTKLTHGSSMPINLPDLFGNSTSLLSTVDEVSIAESVQQPKPKRRNSLPTGSSHGTSAPADILLSPILAKPKLSKAKSTATDTTDTGPKKKTPRKSRRRHSLQGSARLDESFAKLNVSPDPRGTSTLEKTRSTTSMTTSTTSSSNSKKAGSTEESVQITPEEEEQIVKATKMIGLAPPKVDSKAPRRRASLTAVATPEHQPDTTVDKIRRRRESTRVSSRTEKSKLRMKDNSESAVYQRRRDRKVSRVKSSEGMKDESRNANQSPKTPRRSRRSSVQAEPGSTAAKAIRMARKTNSDGGYKCRDRGTGERCIKPKFSLSPSTPRLRPLNRAMDDGSQIGRSNRRNLRRQTSVEESKSEESDDDSDYEPTPKPAVPPSLPVLATRRVTRTSTPDASKSPSRRMTARCSRPRRHRSDTASKDKGAGKKDVQHDLPDLVTPSKERKNMRSRRHKAHESLKEIESSPPIQLHPVRTASGSASKVPNSPEEDTTNAKRRQTDKRLGEEVTKSPSKANRFQRRRSISNKQKETAGEVLKSPKASRTRRTKSSDGAEQSRETGKTPRSARRRKSEASEVQAIKSRIRQAKAIDSALLSINLDTDLDNDEVGAGNQKVSASPDPSSGKASKLMMNGLSF